MCHLPPLLRVASGDWVVQTVCIPIPEEKPAIGRLLLWKDKRNYLRLDRGVSGEHEISFVGCLENQDVIIGRGRLTIGNSEVWLRLEMDRSITVSPAELCASMMP
jgi:hypothetical protein